ncbi:hypothetical protein K2X33_16210, partial [bacterium]|nr:hypothetical protein [bacterium]
LFTLILSRLSLGAAPQDAYNGYMNFAANDSKVDLIFKFISGIPEDQFKPTSSKYYSARQEWIADLEYTGRECDRQGSSTNNALCHRRLWINRISLALSLTHKPGVFVALPSANEQNMQPLIQALVKAFYDRAPRTEEYAIYSAGTERLLGNAKREKVIDNFLSSKTLRCRFTANSWGARYGASCGWQNSNWSTVPVILPTTSYQNYQFSFNYPLGSQTLVSPAYYTAGSYYLDPIPKPGEVVLSRYDYVTEQRDIRGLPGSTVPIQYPQPWLSIVRNSQSFSYSVRHGIMHVYVGAGHFASGHDWSVEFVDAGGASDTTSEGRRLILTNLTQKTKADGTPNVLILYGGPATTP